MPVLLPGVARARARATGAAGVREGFQTAASPPIAIQRESLERVDEGSLWRRGRRSRPRKGRLRFWLGVGAAFGARVDGQAGGLDVSQILAVESHDAVATWLPSGLHVTLQM